MILMMVIMVVVMVMMDSVSDKESRQKKQTFCVLVSITSPAEGVTNIRFLLFGQSVIYYILYTVMTK